MWIFVLYSLVLSLGALAEDECSKRSLNDCVRPTLYNFIPQEISEYNRVCPQLPNFLKCLRDYQVQCEPDLTIFETDEEYNRVHGAFSELCAEGTFLNNVATEHLKCFNETFSKTSCPEEAKAITGPFRSPMKNSEGEDDYTLPIEIMCLEDIIRMNCIAADIGKNCGQAALQATLEFTGRVNFLRHTCGKENAKTVLRGLEAFPLDQQQKEIVIATLEKIILSED